MSLINKITKVNLHVILDLLKPITLNVVSLLFKKCLFKYIKIFSYDNC